MLISSRIKEALRALRSAPTRLALNRLRSRITRSRYREPMVSFGGVLSPGRLVHGGAVKLLLLKDAFKNDDEDFNILYLVSSAQPDFAEDLVKLCRERGIAFIWNQNGVGYPGWAGEDAERHNAPMRALRSSADYVVYQSVFCRECAEMFLGPSEVSGEVIFNPVNLRQFRPADEPLPPGPLRLLAMGTQNYAERVLHPIGCLKLLRDLGIEATLTIAGRLQWKGAQTEVAAFIEMLGLREHVTLHPAFSQDEAVALYQGHQILLHPKYLDPCPTVVVEALACGLPVVGSASGGLPEMVPADCGVLIPAPVVWDRLITPSPEEMASAVREILPRISDFSAAARRHAELTFDHVCWVDRHRAIFQDILS